MCLHPACPDIDRWSPPSAGEAEEWPLWQVGMFSAETGAGLFFKGRRGVWMLEAYRNLSSSLRNLVLSHGPFSNSEHNFSLALKETRNI